MKNKFQPPKPLQGRPAAPEEPRNASRITNIKQIHHIQHATQPRQHSFGVEGVRKHAQGTGMHTRADLLAFTYTHTHTHTHTH